MLIAYLSTVRDGLCFVLQPPESAPSHARFSLDSDSMGRIQAGMDMIVEAVTHGRLERPGVSASRCDKEFQQWLGHMVPSRPQAD
jgi:hypothetical protein